MAAVTVRNIPEETHRALKARAAANGTSTEAEVRAILEQAVRPEGRILLGTELAKFGKRWGGIEFDITRDPSIAKGVDFE